MIYFDVVRSMNGGTAESHKDAALRPMKPGVKPSFTSQAKTDVCG